MEILNRERIKILSDPLLDDKRESRNKSQDFKRRNIKNQERILTNKTYKIGLSFLPTGQISAL
jgi:hypothetical protein